MKALPIVSLTLAGGLALVGGLASGLALSSCGGKTKVDPDARPIPDASELDGGPEAGCVPNDTTDLALQEIVRGLSDPLLLTAPGSDPRLFVVEQRGRIRIVENNELVETPFLDLQDLVRDIGNEQGLLGLAFHPDYAENGRFFVNYTASSPSGDTVVAEYTVSDDPNVANTEGKTLLTFEQPFANHNGGMLAFGADGYLYISTGDGGDKNDPLNAGQRVDTLLGKILRIDVDSGEPYAIPENNPYAGGGGEKEIWALGLRNPWRFSFDSENGDIYIADVGQNEWEEINAQPGDVANVNYGWKIVEGEECFQAAACDKNGLVDPVHVYGHTQGRASITGGYVYRGECLPSIQGRYFFGDFVGEQIYSFVLEGGAATDLKDHTDQIDPNSDISGLTSFGEDGYGELHVISRDGKVFKIVAQP